MTAPQLIAGLIIGTFGLAGAPPSPQGTGGTIRGHVVVPPGPMVTPRPVVGGLSATDHLAVDRSRVVVYLEPTPALTAVAHAPTRARMDQRNEQFAPHILAITAGSTVEFPNNDTTFHNVFSLSRTRTFDLGRYPPGKNGAIRFDRSGIVPVFCDIHSHMSAYILVFDHPFFSVSEESGRYAIHDIPPGTYAVSVWSELGHAPSRRITVGQDSSVEADFEIGRDIR